MKVWPSSHADPSVPCAGSIEIILFTKPKIRLYFLEVSWRVSKNFERVQTKINHDQSWFRIFGTKVGGLMVFSVRIVKAMRRVEVNKNRYVFECQQWRSTNLANGRYSFASLQNSCPRMVLVSLSCCNPHSWNQCETIALRQLGISNYESAKGICLSVYAKEW